ncbi:hypothetical protein VaNZ11_000481, partial [Volvox africanus]
CLMIMMRTSYDQRCAFTARQQAGLPRVVPQVRTCRKLNVRNIGVCVRAAGFWERLLGSFNGSNSEVASADVLARNKLRSSSLELLQLLCDSKAPDLARIEELLDELAGAEGQPFSEDSLGGGPWVVRYTRGKPLLWNLTYNTGRLLNSRNRAAQEFDPATRSAVNLLEINGPDILVEAYGTYEPVDESSVTPKTIRAKISSGRLFLRSWELPLPISGTGYFDVVYMDEVLRVFRSDGRFAVQVRADKFQSHE